MNTHEGCADPRAKIGAIIVEAIRGIEAEVGMSAWVYIAQKLRPAGLKWDRHARVNAIYCFRLLDCGRWLPLNRLYMPLGNGSGDSFDGYEAYADRAVHFPTDPHELVDVWSSDNGHTLYLHHGDPASLKSYYHRFARLAAAMCPWQPQGAACLARYPLARAPT
jgi:hypothetical protein